jgi:nucleoid-associated protein YgaU
MRALSKDEIFEALEEIEMSLPQALSPEQLTKLRTVAQAKGLPLTADESAVVLFGKVPQKVSSGISIQNSAPAPNVNFVRDSEDNSYGAQAARARAPQEAVRKAHEDKVREELDAAQEAKGAPLTFDERQFVMRSVK